MLQKNHAWGSQEKWDTNGTAKKTVLLLLLSSSRNNGSKKNRAQKGAAFLHNEKSKVASEGLQRWRSGPPCRCEWKTHTLPTTFPFKQRETLCKNCTHIRRTLRTFNLLTVPLASMHQNKIVISKTQPARTQVKAAVWNEMRGSLSPAFWRESEIRPPPPLRAFSGQPHPWIVSHARVLPHRSLGTLLESKFSDLSPELCATELFRSSLDWLNFLISWMFMLFDCYLLDGFLSQQRFHPISVPSKNSMGGRRFIML